VPVGREAAPTILPTVIVVPLRILEAYDGTQCKDRNRLHPEIRPVASHQCQMMNFCCRRKKCLHCADRTSVASLRATILPQASATSASTGNIPPSNLSDNSRPSHSSSRRRRAPIANRSTP